MKSRPIIPRELANRDVDEAIGHYLSEGAKQAALGFIEALEQAYDHIGRHPAAGSPRYAHELDLPGLRSWPLTRYPHLVFYIDRGDHIDVWRVLHGQRDIPASLVGDVVAPPPGFGAVPLPSVAQQQGKVWRIGFLLGFSRPPSPEPTG